MVVPMIYDGAGTSADSVISKMHTNGYIGDGAPTYVGMGVPEFASITELGYAKSNSDCYKNFYGISIFSHHKYPDWAESE